MKINPAKKIIVIEPLDSSEISVTSGGLVAKSEKEPQVGRIITIGEPDGKKGLPVDMKEGDIVVYRRFGETQVFAGGKVLYFISFEDILGVIEK